MKLHPLIGVLCAAPASVWAADYLSVEQAQRLMFPSADQFQKESVLLDADLMRRYPNSPAFSNGQFQWIRASQGGQFLGALVVDDVVGKFERITYAVAVLPDGHIKQIEILSYRESHGSEVRLPAWRAQFAGKTATDPLTLGDDIANISGATLSCTHITNGVRRIVTLLEVLRRNHQMI